MKILICPKCNKQIFARFNCSTTVLQCAFCGYVDYEYQFEPCNLHRGINDNLNLEHVMETISKSLNDIRNQTIDINALVYSFAEKWKDLSPIVISEIINSFICTSFNDDIPQANESLFVEYVSDKIPLQDILYRNIDVERKIIAAVKRKESYEETIEYLKAKNEILSTKYSNLEKSYVECLNLLQEKEKIIDSLFYKLDNTK